MQGNLDSNVHRALEWFLPRGISAATWLPYSVRKWVLEDRLNRALAKPVGAGLFDFLEGHTVGLRLTDTQWQAVLTCRNRRLVQVATTVAESEISASTMDFLRLAAGREDPDTLYFQRRLTIQGKVALGLQVKNVLDGLDRESLPRPLRHALLLAYRLVGEAQSRSQVDVGSGRERR